MRLGGESGALLLAADSALSIVHLTEAGAVLCPKAGRASSPQPLHYFVRVPCEGQNLEKIKAGLGKPAALLAKTREFWQGWKPFRGEVSWRLPKPYSDFLTGCTNYLEQMRVKKGERHVLQVGPTVYASLAIVDGNFIIEAARYIGYDTEAADSLAQNWGWQREDGASLPPPVSGCGRTRALPVCPWCARRN